MRQRSRDDVPGHRSAPAARRRLRGRTGPLIDRLVERGLIRRESKRVLGVFRMTTLPAADTRHEAELRPSPGRPRSTGARRSSRRAAGGPRP
ncbi:GPP34 family phosphoprotein [Nonomuraea insulae]|uniref:GPP34 family phosphoprotein n=1 Tax=Nonomuraea insulae TaxID=1616787 RepID=A0ABW1CEL1_9ACTN